MYYTSIKPSLFQGFRDGISESLTLEYKERLNFQMDEERKELLADISSFANISGGDFIFRLGDKSNTIGRLPAL